MENINVLMRDLAETNRQYEQASEEVARMRQTLESSEAYQIYTELQEQMKELRANIEAVALKEYETTNIKQLADGLSIRVYKKVQYDQAEATKWAIANAPTMVKIDGRLFEKHAKAVQDTTPIEFVEIYDDPKVAISSDLSSYLSQ